MNNVKFKTCFDGKAKTGAIFKIVSVKTLHGKASYKRLI